MLGCPAVNERFHGFKRRQRRAGPSRFEFQEREFFARNLNQSADAVGNLFDHTVAANGAGGERGRRHDGALGQRPVETGADLGQAERIESIDGQSDLEVGIGLKSNLGQQFIGPFLQSRERVFRIAAERIADRPIDQKHEQTGRIDRWRDSFSGSFGFDRQRFGEHVQRHIGERRRIGGHRPTLRVLLDKPEHADQIDQPGIGDHAAGSRIDDQRHLLQM